MLDVGGWDFIHLAMRKRVPFDSWVTLEPEGGRLPQVDDQRFRCVVGDGCAMPFEDNSFDTVLNIQVLEHVVDPIRMVQEIARVLTAGGHGIFVIPQTAVMHMAPQHYYNFTRFWIEEVMARSGLEVVQLVPLGGFWSTIASRCVHFILPATRRRGYSTKECRRNVLFYILFPLMMLAVLLLVPLCLILSLGDLTEEPNNHLVLVKKQ